MMNNEELNSRINDRCWYRRSRNERWRSGITRHWGQHHKVIRGEIADSYVPILACAIEDRATGDIHIIQADLISFSSKDPNWR